MSKKIDIMDVRKAVKSGEIEVSIVTMRSHLNGGSKTCSVMLSDVQTGERVKIYEINYSYGEWKDGEQNA